MNYSYKNILKIAAPILFSLLMQQIIGLTDVAFLGHVSQTALGASALGSVYYLCILMIGFGFGAGMQILMGQGNGRKAYGEIGRIFCQGSAFLAALALLLIVGSYLFSDKLLRGLIASDEIYAATVQYVDIRAFGFLFSFAAGAFRAFFVAILKPKILTYTSLVLVISNIFLDYALVFGKFYMPQMGIEGAALASVLAEGLSVLYYIFYMLYTVNLPKYALNKPIISDFALLKKIFKLSVWIMITNFLIMFSWFMFFVAIEKLGKFEIATANVARNIISVPWMVAFAFALSANTIISNLWGEDRAADIGGVCKKIVKLSYFYTMASVLLIMLFFTPIASIFTADSTIVKAAYWPCWVGMLNYLIFIPAQVYINAVAGIGKTKLVMYMDFSAMITYILAIYLVIFVAQASLAVCWLVDYPYSVVLLVLPYYYIKKLQNQDFVRREKAKMQATQ